MKARDRLLALIQGNIEKSGAHLYLIAGGPSPRFVYSISAKEDPGHELILAGASFYDGNQAADIVNKLIIATRQGLEPLGTIFDLGDLGSFTLRSVDDSWVTRLLPGALGFHQVPVIKAFQIVPGPERTTRDVPDLSRPYNPGLEPIWQWQDRPWPYAVSEEAHACTNLDALRGYAITECVRWGKEEWEIFAGPGPDVTKEEMRMVPLGTLLGIDPSLEFLTRIPTEGAWRETAEDEWHPWLDKG